MKNKLYTHYLSLFITVYNSSRLMLRLIHRDVRPARLPIKLKLRLQSSLATIKYNPPPTTTATTTNTTTTLSHFILPFKINKTQADKIFQKNKKFLEDTTANNRVEEVFLPFYSASISNLKTTFSVRYSKDEEFLHPYTMRVGTNIVPMTEKRKRPNWFSTNGKLDSIDYPFTHKSLQIYADFRFCNFHVEKCLSTDKIRRAIPLDRSSIPQPFDAHTMKLSYALEKIVARLYELEKERVIKHITSKYDADRVDIKSIDLHIDEASIQIHNYHLPAYIYGGQKFINGYTGDFDGQVNYSLWKSMMLGASIGTILTPISLVFSPTLSIPLITARLFFGGLIGSIPGGIFSSFQRLRTIKENKLIKKEIKLNKKALDIAIEEQQINNLPADKCRILALDPHRRITSEDLKTAYHREIIKYHPDTNKGSHQFKTEMAQNINNAYKTLSKLIS